MASVSADYRLYGLRIRVDQPIPGMTEAVGAEPPDVFLRQDGPGGAPPDSMAWVPTFEALQGGGMVRQSTAAGPGGRFLRLEYTNGSKCAEFVIHPCGSEVRVRLPEQTTFADIGALLIGSVLGCVLRLRGALCLHASALMIDGRAFAFLGPKGTGKSTTLAVLLRRGCVAVTDDIVVLTPVGEPSAGTFLIQPGPACPRLRPDAAQILCGPLAGLRSQEHSTDIGNSRYLDPIQLDRPPLKEPVPLGGLYLLGPRQRMPAGPRVRPLTGVARLMALRPHAVVGYPSDRSSHVQELRLLSLLAATVPIRQLDRPDGLDNLTAIADAILADIRTLLGMGCNRSSVFE